jgi:signal transduction histidine kinase
VILCGFAAVIGVLTQRRIYRDFTNQVSTTADELRGQLELTYSLVDNRIYCTVRGCPLTHLTDYAAQTHGFIRIATLSGTLPDAHGAGVASAGTPLLPNPEFNTTTGSVIRRQDYKGYRVETRPLPVTFFTGGYIYVQYARKLSDVQDTAARVRFFLAFGVLAGAALALLAGLATARRAMAPIAELTDAARRIERSGDASLRIPKPEARDEVAELSDTLEDMLRSLDASRSAVVDSLARQREFVADASHELRTPLTAVLANLELLEEELAGEQRETAVAALRSTKRMRRLVADLLLLARADTSREAPHRPIDLSSVLIEAAAELEPVAQEHHLSVEVGEACVVDGARDELHRVALNLMENALKHTEAGTAIRAGVSRDGDDVVLVVEDDGPGVPDDIAPRVFERFVRGSSDRGGSTGLGLSIVRAVAETHGGSVELEKSSSGRGARFVVRLPSAARKEAVSAEVAVT